MFWINCVAIEAYIMDDIDSTVMCIFDCVLYDP